MHVALLGPVPPPHGGVQTHVVGLRNYLMGQGTRVSLINITRHRRTDGEGVYYPRSAVALIGLLTRLRPDILHVHLGGDLNRRVLALCLVCAGFPGARSVLTFHSGGYPSSAAGRATNPRSFAGFVLRRIDRLIGVNPEIVELYHRAGVRTTRTAVVEPHDFTLGLPSNGGSVPRTLADFMDDHDPILLSVGLLEPEYEVQLQIEAMTSIRERHPRAGLVVIGSGSLEGELRKAVQASPCSNHLLLAGDVPHAVTLTAIQRSTLLLRTTRYDGDSVSVREALHLGTTVLATDNGMRPPGVRLLRDLGVSSLLDGIDVALNSPPPSSPASQSETSNLERVWQLYRELVPRTGEPA